MLFFYPALSGSQRKIVGTLEDNIDDGVEGAMRQPLGRADKVAGCAVEHTVHRDESFFRMVQYFLDFLVMPYITTYSKDLTSRFAREFGGCLVEHIFLATRNHYVAAEL